MLKKLIIPIALLFIFQNSAFTQTTTIDQLDQTFINWYNKDLSTDAIMGTSVEKVYSEILKDSKKARKKVIVAVIDSGVDIDHEDLQGKIWVNQAEIPGNGIDDDGNGYIDDIHGWNFLGNAKGENIQHENVEYTRIIRDSISNKTSYNRALKMYENELEKRGEEIESILNFQNYIFQVKTFLYQETGIAIESLEDLDKIESTEPMVIEGRKFLADRYKKGFTEEGLIEYVQHINDYLDYHLNKDFNPRSIIGDNPFDLNDRNYGNADVTGPDSQHGTGVAALIAANRNEGIGVDGIASFVEIMAIRSTPNGDERDKDVALAIMYAVDNGADIINMSFGKNFSPQKEFVDEAVKYAEEKGVLLIHAAGNDGANIDLTENYPTAYYLNDENATNWIEVGASAITLDKELAASFSNYGKNKVDIFAPGHDVISADTSNTYSMISGTSFAAPVVAGVAALLLSHYPDLSPQEIKEILMLTSYKPKKPRKIYLPGDNEKRKKVKFKDLSQSGGIVNAYEAMLEAEIRERLSMKDN